MGMSGIKRFAWVHWLAGPVTLVASAFLWQGIVGGVLFLAAIGYVVTGAVIMLMREREGNLSLYEQSWQKWRAEAVRQLDERNPTAAAFKLGQISGIFFNCYGADNDPWKRWTNEHKARFETWKGDYQRLVELHQESVRGKDAA